MKLVRYADRPDLLERRFEELSGATFPDFMHHNEPGGTYWGRLYEDFPDFQVALLDDDELVAEAHAVPVAWDGTPDGSPGRLGRGVRARHDLRPRADGAVGACDQRTPDPPGRGPLAADDRGVPRHGARRRARDP